LDERSRQCLSGVLEQPVATESNLHQPSSGVRTYRGRTFGEILPLIRSELGPDAVILREREGLVGGVGGFFAQRFIEVDARRGDVQAVHTDEPEAGEARETRDDLPPALPHLRTAPPARRFETAAFIDRLREATATLRDDDVVEISAAPVSTVTPVTPVSAAKPKRKSKESSAPKRKSKSKAKQEPKPKAKERDKGKAKPPKQAEPLPRPDPDWAAPDEPTPRPESDGGDARRLELLLRVLPDFLVAVLLLVLLGPRRFRSSRRASERGRCPVCGSRFGSAGGGHGGGSPHGWLRSSGPRGSGFGCRCH
jgi:hypothetical protein